MQELQVQLQNVNMEVLSVDSRRGAFSGIQEQNLGPSQTDRFHVSDFDLRFKCFAGTAGSGTMTMGASTSGPSQRYYTVKPGISLKN